MNRNGITFFKSLFYLFFFILFVCVLLSACASTKNADESGSIAKINIVAADNINPSPRGTPSPVVLKIFQLKDDQLFNRSDFFALYLHSKQTLGDDYVSEKEVTVTPNGSGEIQLSLNSHTRYLAVLAAYQDINQAKWYDIKKVHTSWGRMSVDVILNQDEITLR